MIKLTKQLQGVLFFCGTLFIALQLFVTQHIVLGSVGTALWLIGSVPWWMRILYRYFFVRGPAFFLWILGAATQLILLSLLLAPFVAWYRLTGVVMLGMMTAVGLFGYGIARKKARSGKTRDESALSVFVDKRLLWKLPFSVLALYVASVVGMIVWVIVSQQSGMASSPWQLLPSQLGYALFLLTIVFGLLLFSRMRLKALLFLVVLQSLFVHLLLPLSHEMPFGGDIWRTMAVQGQLAAEKPILPVLFGPEATTRVIKGYAVPDALLVPQKYIYSQFWAITTAAIRVTSLNPITVNRFFLPVLWGLAVPAILYVLGRRFFGEKRYAIWFAAASTLPFSWYALGSLTLAVSLGTVTFLLFLMLYLQSGLQKHQSVRRALVVVSFLLVFSYPVHAVLCWLVLLARGPIKFFLNSVKKHTSKEATIWRWGIGIIAGTAVASVFLSMELLAKTSIVANINVVGQLRQFVGQLTGVTYAMMVRPHDILPMNIVFNHTQEHAMVWTVFTQWRYHLILVMLFILTMCVIAFVAIVRKERSEAVFTCVVLAIATIPAYGIGWYLLQGDRSFIRRLDGVIALLFLIGVFYGWAVVLQRWYPKKGARRGLQVLAVFGIVAIAWTGTTILQSGPDMRVVSAQEYTVAEHIANTDPAACVLADTWILLPVEALTHGRIIGGGFPIDKQFGQPLRVDLMKQIAMDPDGALARIDTIFPDAASCVIAWKFGIGELELFDQFVEEFGDPAQDVGEYAIWRVSLLN